MRISELIALLEKTRSDYVDAKIRQVVVFDECCHADMFIPRIKDREHHGAITNKAGKIVRHACNGCDQEFPVTEKGVWFERADALNKWRWVCQTCCAVRGIYVG